MIDQNIERSDDLSIFYSLLIIGGVLYRGAFSGFLLENNNKPKRFNNKSRDNKRNKENNSLISLLIAPPPHIND